MEEKTPTLLLGAGFSYGAINENGEDLPLGKNLVEKLYQHMFIDNPPDKEILDEDIDGAEQYKNAGDLKGLCGLLRDEGRVDERDEYLTATFMGATISDKSKLYNIGSYPRILLYHRISCSISSKMIWKYDSDGRQTIHQLRYGKA